MRLVLIIFLLNQTITSAQNKLPDNWYLFYNIKNLENSRQVYKDPKDGKFYMNKSGKKVYLKRDMLEKKVTYKDRKKK